MGQHSKSAAVRPKKPYRDFPLFAHRNGCWAKKIKGRFVFFGPWADASGALDRYMAQRDELHSGAVPRAAQASLRPTRQSTPSPTLARNVKASGAGTVALAGAKNATGANVGRRVATGAEAVGSREADGGAARTIQIEGGSGLTLRDLANHFMTTKQRRLDAEEMGLRSFSEQHRTAENMLKFFGKNKLVSEITVDDFGRLRAKLATTRGPVALGNEIGRVRSIFKHAYEAELIDKPMRFGAEFRKPSKKSIRLARRASGPKMFEPAEIHALLEAAGPQMRAMILLGLNCGMGNTDVGELTKSHVSLKDAVIEFPRPKTGIARRCVLWPETVAALRAVGKVRPAPKSSDDKDLTFITKQHNRWVRVTEPGARSQGKNQAVVKDAVAAEFTKTARAAGVLKDRRGFYALRHTFRTVADEVGDRRAVDLIMGHEDGADISNAYVERIGDDRLQKVVDHVRGWVFGSAKAAE